MPREKSMDVFVNEAAALVQWSISSRNLYKSLNRSRLGYYSVGVHLLWLGANAEKSGLDGKPSWISSYAPAGFYNPDQAIFLDELTKADEDRLKVATELHYWWKAAGLFKEKTELMGGWIDPEYALRLQHVISYPELHDYFKVGIWELNIAANALKDDVDPHLILEMV